MKINSKTGFIKISFKAKVTETNINLFKKLKNGSYQPGDTGVIDYVLELEEGSKTKYLSQILMLINSDSKISEVSLAGSLG